MKRFINFKSVEEYPLPTSGEILVSVTTMYPDPHGQVSFVSKVTCDEIGLMDDHGDYYQHAKDVTHWARFPKPVTSSFK